MTTTNLTPGQRRFFLSYLPEFTPAQMAMSEPEFIQAVLSISFDGPASVGDTRVAQNLANNKLLKTLQIHACGIYVEFNEASAKILADLRSTDPADSKKETDNLHGDTEL